MADEKTTATDVFQVTDPAPDYQHPVYKPTTLEQSLLDALPATTDALLDAHRDDHTPDADTSLSMERYLDVSINRLKTYDLMWLSMVNGVPTWVKGDGKPRTLIASR